jgi:hypothetical protein
MIIHFSASLLSEVEEEVRATLLPEVLVAYRAVDPCLLALNPKSAWFAPNRSEFELEQLVFC